MAFSSFFILQMIKWFDGERTMSGIYHVLRGKQSAQSIQDSYLFSVRPFFHALESYSREAFDRQIEALIKAGLVMRQQGAPDHLLLTPAGVDDWGKGSHHYSIPSGLGYTDVIHGERLFWLRVQLLVQTLSELRAANAAFFPVTRTGRATESVRAFLHHQSTDYSRLARRIKEELSALLEGIDDQTGHLLINQLSGNGVSGQTLDQIARLDGLDPIETHLRAKSGLRTILHRLINEPQLAPDLLPFYERRVTNLTRSAQRTHELMDKIQGLNQLAALRHLAVSTIQDHIVEMALKINDFDCSLYLTSDQYDRVLQAQSQLHTRQLKPLKKYLGEPLSFFQIRLALARASLDERNEQDK
ncbi:MAG: helix-turn-helix domain-containing protein [Sporolactobacillus sp.]